MRQGQQNRRGRGRNNNNPNRKGQNPLTRSFESTGPDVKIRGTPAHIAEKYMVLARDAQTSGDPVLAENYLQHAEHYTRIIMAFRDQQMSQGGDAVNGGVGRHRPGGFGDPSGQDDFGDDEGDDMGPDMSSQAPHVRGNEPQPRSFEGQRGEERGPRPGHDHHRQPHRERQGGEPRGFAERHDRQDRHDRGDRYPRHERQDRPPQQGEPGGSEGGQMPRRVERPVSHSVPHHEQPEFLRRPVRRPRREDNGGPGDDSVPATTVAGDDTGE